MHADLNTTHLPLNDHDLCVTTDTSQHGIVIKNGKTNGAFEFSSLFRMYAVGSGSRYVAFSGLESRLSNLAPAEIQVELPIRTPGPGQPSTRIYTFGSVEHAYQFFKLQFLGLQCDAQELHQRYATEIPFHNQASFGVMTLARDMIQRA